MKKLYCILLIFIGLSSSLLAQNSGLKLVSFTGDSLISIGQSAIIKWDYANAKEVILYGTAFSFNTCDSLTVYPQTTSYYTFVGINGKDSLKYKWKISVRSFDDTGDLEIIPVEKIEKEIEMIEPSKPIKTEVVHETTEIIKTENIAPVSISATKFTLSNNDYFVNNTIDYKESKLPITLKIASIKPHKILPNTLTIQVLPIDKNGNFISNLNMYSQFCNFTYNLQCETVEHTGIIKEFPEKNISANGPELFSITIDNSIFCDKPKQILDAINIFTQNLQSNDNIQLYSIGNEIYLSSNQTEATNAAKLIDQFKKEATPKGLNAMYRCCSEIIENAAQGNKNTVYTLIISGKDNASLIYDINDLVSIAQMNEAKINVIGIGEKIEPFALSYLATQTGGRYYQIENNDIQSIASIMSEISNKTKHYYEMNISFDDNLPYLCDKTLLNLTLNYKESKTSEEIEYSFIPMPHYAMYQSLALFEKDASIVENLYVSNIRIIADILQDNDDIAIQLIGNTDMATPSEQSRNLSLDRVVATYQKLTELGVPADKIRFKGIGNAKPIFFTENEKWQQDLNNRVDIKWLAPSLYPFEIITQTVSSENAAFENVLEWETLGYNSYYERYIENGMPVYRVKLWGFKTEIEANQAIQTLKRDFDFEFVIE